MSEDETRFDTPLGLLRWISWAQMQAGEEWVRERGLTREQAFVLGYLVKNPGAIQRDIAQVSRTTPASVSSLLQGLERRGLVERRTEPGDVRSKRVHATPEGAALVAGFEPAVAAIEEKILAPLDATERAQLHELLRRITAALPPPTR
ncbi:DNA-binding MarR family transcriptional regulator [Sediminihabitans luteus]|uniref:DNA-binding MarR family transcriptional regulator n=1 Tax=Sediminihabitans luteus TaxID=1138585 RepID=A0A2M9CDH5_9CELL|nr:MarR family transcriptional regulator [Sediminihabitans luteus]PJJ69929.1 DNA-binding MarR family transcriptional regulator [Sediminihabitans luteus]GII99249.1 MarR family transcriptional regulator [Sediminihabitans luteus]